MTHLWTFFTILDSVAKMLRLATTKADVNNSQLQLQSPIPKLFMLVLMHFFRLSCGWVFLPRQYKYCLVNLRFGNWSLPLRPFTLLFHFYLFFDWHCQSPSSTALNSLIVSSSNFLRGLLVLLLPSSPPFNTRFTHLASIILPTYIHICPSHMQRWLHFDYLGDTWLVVQFTYFCVCSSAEAFAFFDPFVYLCKNSTLSYF